MTLRVLRKRVGLRQVDVSSHPGLDQTTVSPWEAGRHRPSKKRHNELAKLYGCTVEDLIQAIDTKE